MGLFSNTSERNLLMYGIGQQQLAEQRAEALRQQGQKDAIGAIDAGEAPALNALGTGYDAARASYSDASKLYDPYVQSGQKGQDMYLNSLGLNGTDGNTAATGAFHASPGYQWSVDQATDGVARKASALGALGSGNTMAAISDRAGHMADQEYSGWQDRLSGLGQQGLTATGAQAGLTKGIGDLSAQQGRDTSDIYTGDATRRAGVYTGLTSAGMSNIQNSANQISGLTSGYMKSADDAAKNSWGLGMGLANVGSNLLGLKTPGGGSLGSSALSSLGWL